MLENATRKQALTLFFIAGANDDGAEFTRLLMGVRRVSSAAAHKAFAAGYATREPDRFEKAWSRDGYACR